MFSMIKLDIRNLLLAQLEHIDDLIRKADKVKHAKDIARLVKAENDIIDALKQI